MIVTKPAISVIMGVYNSQRFLHEAIDSLLSQTFANFELVVVDDGSTDESLAILKGFRDPRLKILQNPRNMGLPSSLNRGIAASAAPLIARLDADDLAEPTRLERQLQAMEDRPELAALGTWTTEIDEQGETIGEWTYPPSEAMVRWGMAVTNVIFHPTVIMRRDAMLAVGSYNETFLCSDDYNLFTRLIMAGYPVDTLPEKLVQYRRSDGQISTARREEQHRTANSIRRAYLEWLIGESPDDATMKTMGAWRVHDGQPDPKALPEAMRLEQKVRQRVLAAASAEERELINETSRRLLLLHAERLREGGDIETAWLLCREAARCGWRAAVRRSTMKQALQLAPALMWSAPAVSEARS